MARHDRRSVFQTVRAGGAGHAVEHVFAACCSELPVSTVTRRTRDEIRVLARAPYYTGFGSLRQSAR